MKKRLIYFALLICVATTVVVDPVSAQNKRVGTSSGNELLIPIGARDLAMGGSSLASSIGVEAIYWNPAGLGRMGHSAEAMFSSMTYIADIGVSYGAVGASFGDFGVLALSVKSLDFGDILLTTDDDPEGLGGRIFSPTFVTVGLSYARGVTDAISVGGTIKVISEQIDQVSASGAVLDFGIQYQKVGGIPGLSLGVTVKNIGTSLKFDGPGLLRNATSRDGRRSDQKYKSEAGTFELPSLVEIGMGYEAKVGDNMGLALNGSFTNNNLLLDEYRIGGEYSISFEGINIFGRAGTAIVPKGGNEEQEDVFGATFGVGLNYSVPGLSITVDYAYRQVEFFDANNVFSIKLGF